MYEPFSIRNESTYVLTPFLKKSSSHVDAGISTRIGGVSEVPFSSLNMGLHVNDNKEKVIKNRKFFSEINNIPLAKWIYAEQIHHNKVVNVSNDSCGRGAEDFETSIESTDGLYTVEKGIVLTAGYADCVPLFFYSPAKQIIGIAHAGWKGTVTNIGRTMVTKWKELEGVDPRDILCAIGPAICERCYEVNQKVIDEVLHVHPSSKDEVYKEIGLGKYLLNLKQLNKELLLAEGIREENISITNYCTSCNNDLFFSHRKEKGKTGRLMAYITLKG